MPIVATITRTSYGQFFSQVTGVNPGASGGTDFTLRKADGTSLGMYRSVSEAQAIFQRFHGSNRILKWLRRDLAGDIEQHICIGTPLDPSEVWQLQAPQSQLPNAQPVSSLVDWIEPAAVPGSVKLFNAATGVISTISDLSQRGNFWQAVGGPTLVLQGDPAFNGRPVIDLDRPSAQGFSVPGLAALAPPYTVMLVADNRDGPGFASVLVHVDGAGDDFFIRRTALGLWECAVGVTTLAGPSAFSVSIVTAKVTTTEVQFRVNGVAIGTIAASPAVGALKIGGFDTVPWEGRLAIFTLATLADPDNTRILQEERYCRERYQ